MQILLPLQSVRNRYILLDMHHKHLDIHLVKQHKYQNKRTLHRHHILMVLVVEVVVGIQDMPHNQLQHRTVVVVEVLDMY